MGAFIYELKGQGQRNIVETYPKLNVYWFNWGYVKTSFVTSLKTVWLEGEVLPSW